MSSRTVQYIQQLTNQINAERLSDTSGEESNGIESIHNNENKVSFYMDEATGKYLVTYFNFIKHQLESKENLFPLFDE